jgi:geranylgeranyl reductase family protein
MLDVIVIGAGPAGLRCASLLEKQGLDLLVLDRKKEIGLPVQCSGLVSSNLDKLVRPPEECIEHRVKGAVIHGPAGKEVRLEKPGTAAYVLDRRGFDRFLASRVKSEIRLGEKVSRLDFGKDSVKVRTDKGEVKASAVLGCDGPSSVVARHFRVQPMEMVQGVIEIESGKDDSDKVEMWVDREVCDGFLWRIPRGRSVEYGMLGSRVKFSGLEQFFRLGKDLEKRAGLIPIGPCKSYFGRALLVGDAAGQTKPWSGGGVIYGLTAAGHAARVMGKALKNGDLSEKALEDYEKAWKQDLWQPICTGMMARQVFRDMGNQDLQGLFEKLEKMDLNKLDMDFPVMGFS